MNKQHINFYCNSSLLFFCKINGTQLQSLPSQLQRLSENDPVMVINNKNNNILQTI
jgi:hypothetical protein